MKCNTRVFTISVARFRIIHVEGESALKCDAGLNRPLLYT